MGHKFIKRPGVCLIDFLAVLEKLMPGDFILHCFFFRFILFYFIFFQDKSEQSRNASDSIIQNLEEKIADMENRVGKPSVESTEEVIKLRTRLQESEQMLQQAEKQIGELETKKESWRQEVIK